MLYYYYYYWSLLYSAILRSWADSLRLQGILHEWIAFYSVFFEYPPGVLTAWLVPHETAAVLHQVRGSPPSKLKAESMQTEEIKPLSFSWDHFLTFWGMRNLIVLKEPGSVWVGLDSSQKDVWQNRHIHVQVWVPRRCAGSSIHADAALLLGLKPQVRSQVQYR